MAVKPDNNPESVESPWEFSTLVRRMTRAGCACGEDKRVSYSPVTAIGEPVTV